MSRILIVGAHPLPMDTGNTLFALGLRTWHLTKPLLDDGHEICLFTGQVPPPKEEQMNISDEVIQKDRLTWHKIGHIDRYVNTEILQSIHDSFKPDAILGINTFPASVASRLKTDKPFWLDLNGSLMMEAQAKAALDENNKMISVYWEQEQACLRAGDKFSTVSLPQMYLLLGELAVLRRLNSHTFGYSFATPIPNSVEHCEYQPQKRVIRGTHVKEEDFVILWSGGYNTWTDVALLFQSLETLMAEYPQVHFVSTGGAIPHHNEDTYHQFQELIKTSKYLDRYHLLGWVPTDDIHEYYFESNLGISLDTFNYETLTGARNRLIHMMKCGLPVLTTLGTEISEVISRENLGLTVPIGSPELFIQALRTAVNHPEELRQTGIRGKQYIQDHYTFEKTTRDLREWMKHPTLSPDKIVLIEQSPSEPPHSQKKPWELARDYFRKLLNRSI